MTRIELRLSNGYVMGWWVCNSCARQHSASRECFDPRRGRVELLPLVCIGHLRNGRPLFMPRPEWQLILMGFGAETDETFDRFDDALDADAFRYQLIADHQRAWDGIVTGETRAFDQVEDLPAFAQILRLSA